MKEEKIRKIMIRYKLTGRQLLITIFLHLVLPLELFGGTNFTKLCNKEISKEIINKKLIVEYCIKAGDNAIKEKKVGNASWYYLLGGKFDKNINEIQLKIDDEFSANIGHSYLLKGDLNSTKIMYKKFLKSSSIHWVNKAIQNDFISLLKLYPQQKNNIKIGLEMWNKIYTPLKPIKNFYSSYKKAKKEKKYKEAIEYLLKIIQLEKKYHKNNKDIATNYNNLGGAYKAMGEYSTALKFYKKDLNLSEKIWGKHANAIALSYKSMGKIYHALKEYSNSLKYYQKALSISKNNLGENHEFTAIIYNNIAKVYEDMGKHTKALQTYQKTLNIRKKVLGENHLSTATTYNNIGLLNNSMGEYSKALEYIQKSLNISKKILGKKHLFTAKIYNNKGFIYKSMGKYDKALKFYQQSLNIRKEILSNNHPSIFTSYNNIGEVYQAMGEYPNALAYYKKALNITKKSLKNSATVYNNIALVYNKIGEYSKALEYYKKALNISKELVSSQLYTATIYNNIGLLYNTKGAYQKALKFHKSSLKILNQNHPYIATTYNNIALIYNYIGKHAKALEYYQKALKINKKSLKKNHPSIGTIYNNIGLVYQSMKKYKKALKFYQQALEIRNITVDSNHPSMITSHNSIGQVYYFMKNYTKAYEYSSNSFKLFIKNKNKNFVILDSKTKEEYLKENIYLIKLLLESTTEYLIQLKKENNQTTVRNVQQKFLNNWLKYKGTLFEYKNLLSMIENSPKTDTETKQNIKELKKLTIQLDDLDNSDKKPKNYQKKKESIEEHIHNIEVNLSKQNQKFKEQLDLQKIDYLQIAQKLKPNQLYIDFAKTDENYYIFTLDNKGDITFEQLDNNISRNIDSNITKFLEINKKIAEDVTNKEMIKNLRPQTKQSLSNLYKLLISKNIDKSELIISPDGLLNFLPFEALFNGKKYLVEDYTLKYISSGQEFIRQAKRESTHSSSEVVLFGSPNFEYGIKGAKSTLSPFDSHTYSALDSSREINVIKKFYHHAKIYQKENASVDNLMQIKNPKILHLSTHGFFFDDKTILNPMRRSGLALSSANRAEYESNRTGLITALKLSSMELYNTELVVLSACETGLGTIQKAEGVVGLPKAFIQAGAKNVIMSLWSVSEQKTALLMEKFYTHIANGEEYALALRNAKLEMIDRHPYYWSAFIISGI